MDGSSTGELIPELATSGLQQLIELEVVQTAPTDLASILLSRVQAPIKA